MACELVDKEDPSTCSERFNCCDCGGNDCGCAYCFSCNACDECKAEERDMAHYTVTDGGVDALLAGRTQMSLAGQTIVLMALKAAWAEARQAKEALAKASYEADTLHTQVLALVDLLNVHRT